MMPLLAMTAPQIRKVIPMNNDEILNARLALKWVGCIYVLAIDSVHRTAF
jgi:hypothetical protein